LVVGTAAALVGSFGLDVQLEACSAVEDLVIPDQLVFGGRTFAACNTVTAFDLDLQDGADVAMMAGSRVILGNGFSVAQGGRLEIGAGPNTKHRFVQYDLPGALSSFWTEFGIDASGLTMGVGSQFDLLVGYNPQGKPIFKVTLWYDEEEASLVGAAFVAAYDYESWWKTATLTLDPGLRMLNAGWYSATPEGYGKGNFSALDKHRIGQTAFQYLYLEDEIASIRWGALNIVGDVSGSVKLDHFRSWTESP
jgi:hypothetical protein